MSSIKSPKKIDFATELNPEQLDVVLHGDGPCLVLAGAGSGKTRTITYRVAYLLERGVDPSEILLLTFTNKAAREMLQRAELLVGSGVHGLRGGTFHSVANRILRQYGSQTGFGAGFSILDMDDVHVLLKAILKERHVDTATRKFPTANVLANIFSLARNTLKPVGDLIAQRYPSFEPLIEEIGELGSVFATRKRESRTMDFDDLLQEMAGLLQHPQVSAELARQCRYLLVDEYQDTNALQAAIVRGFGSAHGNVLVVGDDAQSIYAFRGADVSNILAFPKWYPNARTFKLVHNYRSTPEILELANESIAKNEHQFPKELITTRSSGSKPKLVPLASASQEAQYVADQIAALRTQGSALRTMAVLFRSSAHSQQLEFELLKRDIPYEYRGGMKFFDRAHIKDVISYLRIMQNPQDEPAWLRVLSLQEGIGATTAAQLAAQMRRVSEFGKVLEPDPVRALSAKARIGWNRFMDIARVAWDQSPAPGEMLKAVLENGYADYAQLEYPDWRDRVEDVEQFVTFAQGYDRLDQLLADIALYDDAIGGKQAKLRSSPDEAAADRLILSTIHQAKGLEWDTVFVIHLADGLFPHRRASAEESGMEEERRLFYVAVTRAQRRLFLTYPITAGFDAFAINPPSVFVEEVSPRLLERVDFRSGQSPARRSVSEAEEWSSEDFSWGAGSSDEPTIQLDRSGNRKDLTRSQITTIFKKKSDLPF